MFRPAGFVKTTNRPAATPEVTPAERSISPSRITNVSAMASVTSVAAWVSRFAKLSSVRKNGLRKVKRMLSTRKPPMAGRAPMSPDLTFWNQPRT